MASAQKGLKVPFFGGTGGNNEAIAALMDGILIYVYLVEYMYSVLCHDEDAQQPAR
jgi:hypothetical protein